MKFKLTLFLVVYLLRHIQGYIRNNHGEYTLPTKDFKSNTKIINDITIDVNKKFLNSIDTRLLNEIVLNIKNLIQRINSQTKDPTEKSGDGFEKNMSKNILKIVQLAHDIDKTLPNVTKSPLVSIGKYLAKKEVKVFYKANSAKTGNQVMKSSSDSNNVFPLIAIEDSKSKTNENYLLIKINKELSIVIASVILLTLVVLVILNNLSKCLSGSKKDSPNFYFRQCH